LPVPSISLGAQVTTNVESTAIVWGLSLPLPFLDRNQGPIAKASAEAASRSLSLEADLLEAQAAVECARSVLLRRREALASLEGQSEKSMPQLRKMAEDAYRGGRTGILDLLDAFRAQKELRLRTLEQRENVKVAEAALIAAAALDVSSL